MAKQVHQSVFYVSKLVLLVADISFLSGIESQVADGSNQGVDTASDVTQNQVCPSSGGMACGLQGGMVDDQATDPAQEKGQQEANQIVTFYATIVKCLDVGERNIWGSVRGGVRGICLIKVWPGPYPASNTPPAYCIPLFKSLNTKKIHTRWCGSFLAE